MAPAAHPANLPVDRGRSTRLAPRWVLVDRAALEAPEHALDLARAPDLADHRVPDSAHGPVLAEQRQPARHHVHSAHLRAVVADARSIPRPKKAQ